MKDNYKLEKEYTIPFETFRDGYTCCLTRKMQKIDTQNTKKSTLCKKAS